MKLVNWLRSGVAVGGLFLVLCGAVWAGLAVVTVGGLLTGMAEGAVRERRALRWARRLYQR